MRGVVVVLERILERNNGRLILLNLEVCVGVDEILVVQTNSELLDNVVEGLYTCRVWITLNEVR